MFINQLADKYHITVRTIRHYEDVGLIISTRSSSNIRQYDAEQIERVELILLLKGFGFTLSNIKIILSYDDHQSIRRLLKDELQVISRETSAMLKKKHLLSSLLSTFGSDDISKHTLKHFIDEQLYFDDEQERMVSMITGTETTRLELGSALIPIATGENGNSLLFAIKTLRKQLEEKYGKELEKIRVIDNLDLSPNEYHILKDNVVVLKGRLETMNENNQITQIVSDLEPYFNL